MENIQINIKDGIKLHIIPNDIYKTNLIRIAFTIDADKDTVTDTAMLPLILKQGSMNYPTQEKINTRLEELYGAEFVANMDKKGDLQVISFEADCIKLDNVLSSVEKYKKYSVSLLEALIKEYVEEINAKTALKQILTEFLP